MLTAALLYLYTERLFVFQGSSVHLRLWGDASVWPRIWPRPATVHPPQPFTNVHIEPEPHPQLSHSMEVLLQRQLWLEGILWGESRMCFCVRMLSEARCIKNAQSIVCQWLDHTSNRPLWNSCPQPTAIYSTKWVKIVRFCPMMTFVIAVAFSLSANSLFLLLPLKS